MVGKKRMQELMARYSTPLPSALSSPNTTMQAPQSPSAQPSFVPVRRKPSLSYSSPVVERETFSAHTTRPSRRKRSQSTLPSPDLRVDPRRDLEVHMVVLIGMGDTDTDDRLLDESGLR